MKLTTKHRVTVVLTPKQYEAIAKKAEADQTSLATIIRQIIAKGLKS